MSSIDAMGPGTPTPASVSPRPKGDGQPLQYVAKARQIAADVGRAGPGTNSNVSFEPRPPIHPPGQRGVGDKGSFVDARA